MVGHPGNVAMRIVDRTQARQTHGKQRWLPVQTEISGRVDIAVLVVLIIQAVVPAFL